VGLAHDQWQLLDDAMLTVDLFRELLEDGDVPLGPGLVHHFQGVALRLGRQGVEHGTLVDAVVPDLEEAHLGVAPHALAVGPHDRLRGRLDIRLVSAHEPGGYSRARRQPLQVPLPRTGVNLVEIVDGEDQVAFGGGKDAEVGNVHVAAGAHTHAGHRRGRQIARHHRRRAAQEGEGRRQHAGKAHRHKLLRPRQVLLLQDGHRIGATRPGLVLGMGFARHLFPQSLAGRDPLVCRRTGCREALQQGLVVDRIVHALERAIDILLDRNRVHEAPARASRSPASVAESATMTKQPGTQ
jgi:hypothetical protein